MLPVVFAPCECHPPPLDWHTLSRTAGRINWRKIFHNATKLTEPPLGQTNNEIRSKHMHYVKRRERVRHSQRWCEISGTLTLGSWPLYQWIYCMVIRQVHPSVVILPIIWWVNSEWQTPAVSCVCVTGYTATEIRLWLDWWWTMCQNRDNECWTVVRLLCTTGQIFVNGKEYKLSETEIEFIFKSSNCRTAVWWRI